MNIDYNDVLEDVRNGRFREIYYVPTLADEDALYYMLGVWFKVDDDLWEGYLPYDPMYLKNVELSTEELVEELSKLEVEMTIGDEEMLVLVRDVTNKR